MGAKKEFTCTCCGRQTSVEVADLDMCTDALPETTLWILNARLVDIWKYGRGRVKTGEHKFFSTLEEIDAEYARLCAEGKDVQYATEPEAIREMCESCTNRGGLCQHNFKDHQEMGAHSSRPHWNDAGADDPSTCPHCRNSDGVQKGIPRVMNKV